MTTLELHAANSILTAPIHLLYAAMMLLFGVPTLIAGVIMARLVAILLAGVMIGGGIFELLTWWSISAL